MCRADSTFGFSPSSLSLPSPHTTLAPSHCTPSLPNPLPITLSLTPPLPHHTTPHHTLLPPHPHPSPSPHHTITHAGSGIPEMKTVLRGIDLHDYLSIRTLLAKTVCSAFQQTGNPMWSLDSVVSLAASPDVLLINPCTLMRRSCIGAIGRLLCKVFHHI